MNRTRIKIDIRNKIFENLGPVSKATILIPIVMIIQFLFFKDSPAIQNIDQGNYDFNIQLNAINSFTWISEIVTLITVFVGIDLARGDKIYRQLDYKDNFNWINNAKDLWDLFAIYVVMSFFTFLWTLLLIIPGIIKGLGYSQAPQIYFDRKFAGTPVTYRESLKISDRMMDGEKGSFFVIHLSFILWNILGSGLMSAGLQIGGGPFASVLFVLGVVVTWFTTVYLSFTLGEFYEYVRN